MERKTSKEANTGGALVLEKQSTPAKKRKSNQLPPYHVILLNDDDHTVEYVLEMLKALFGHPEEMGIQMAKDVDREGRVIVLTTHKERAEFKREQIQAYGADIRVSACKGSMSAVIEPAE